MAAFWINFRNDFRGNEVAERVCTFVEGFVFSLDGRKLVEFGSDGAIF